MIKVLPISLIFFLLSVISSVSYANGNATPAGNCDCNCVQYPKKVIHKKPVKKYTVRKTAVKHRTTVRQLPKRVIPTSVAAKLTPGINLSNVSAVDVGDNIELHISAGQSQQRLWVLGDAADVDDLSVHVEGNVLVLRKKLFEVAEQTTATNGTQTTKPQTHLTYHFTGPIKVNMTLNNLAMLNAVDDSTVEVDGLTHGYYGLTVVTENNSSAQLRGTVNLQKLISTGNSTVDAQWISSNHVIVRANDNTHIVLAGKATILDASLQGKANLNAKYLRAQQAYVKTVDQAIAEITPLNFLNTFASDTSNIYYYKSPHRQLTRYSLGSGSVLQMGYWN